MSVFDVFFENSPRIFDTTGTGQIHPQNARANSTMSTTAMRSEMTARGIMVLVAIMVSSAPSGHRSEMSCQPIADRVPTPTWVAKPTATRPMTASGMMMRSRLVFTARTSYDSMGRTTMARSVAPAEMEPFCSETQTLSQAPQPLHRSLMTKGRMFSSSSMAS